LWLCLFCLFVCLFVCLFMGLLPRQLKIASIDSHQTGFVGKSSDHLRLIKFWPSCAPGKGVCGGANFFGSVLLQPARSVCVFPSAFFFTLRAKLRGAVYCNGSCLFVGLWLCLFVCVSVTTITRNCVHRSSSNWVCR